MLCFLINPKAGNGKGRRVWQAVEQALRQTDAAYRAELTNAPGDAERWAGQFARESGEEDIVIAVGGDGTLHEAANGLLAGGFRGRLGLIPAGSGNDFARAYGIPTRPIAALQLILHGSGAMETDVLSVGARRALNAVGAGLDGEVAYAANRAFYKRWLNRLGPGKLSYVLALMQALLVFRPAEVHLSVRRGPAEGQAIVRFRKVWLIAFANIPYYGGGMKIAPQARSGDGQIDVCVVCGISRLELLRVFPLVYGGKHTAHPAVHFLRGQAFGLQAARPFRLHADGESAGTTPAEVVLHPGRLRIVVPDEQV